MANGLPIEWDLRDAQEAAAVDLGAENGELALKSPGGWSYDIGDYARCVMHAEFAP